MTLTHDLYRTITILGPCLGVVLVAIWFAWQEARDGEKF